MKLSLLDRSRTRAGVPDAEALEATISRAVHAEQVGYERFWVAEHHAVPGIASGTPAVLLAALGARTSRIRIGSGGVMLPLHQPLVVAEQFLVLDALYPGRVDLGLGRSLGFTPPVRRALRRDLDAVDAFEEELIELRGYFEGAAAVTARPATGRPVPMHLLATGRGLQVAARLGLPVVIGGPILDSEELPEALRRYRKEFPPLESPAAIRAASWSDQVRRRVEASLERAVAGSPSTVRRRLEQLVERTDAEELLASTSTHDRDALLVSDRMLRELLR